MPNATMGGRRGQSDQVEQRATANSDHVGMPIDVVAIDVRLNIRDVEIGVFDPFASFQNYWRTDQPDPGRGRKVGFDFTCEVALG